jgi:hypothetical protein
VPPWLSPDLQRKMRVDNPMDAYSRLKQPTASKETMQ